MLEWHDVPFQFQGKDRFFFICSIPLIVIVNAVIATAGGLAIQDGTGSDPMPLSNAAAWFAAALQAP